MLQYFKNMPDAQKIVILKTLLSLSLLNQTALTVSSQILVKQQKQANRNARQMYQLFKMAEPYIDFSDPEFRVKYAEYETFRTLMENQGF